jgi:uncharacterized OB-fold protein
MLGDKKRVPIVEGIFTWPSEDPRLIAGKCKSCGALTFPKMPICPNPECDDKLNVEEVLLSKRGKLWSWTIQRFQPPAFRMAEPFKPFGIGIVEIPEGLRIVGMLTTTEGLRIGMDVELVIEKLYEDEEKEYLTYKWKPIY